jgi:cytoskeletal protein RodZ
MRWLSASLLAAALLFAGVVPAALAQNQNAQQNQPTQPPSSGSASGQGNSNMPVIEPKAHSNMPVIAPTGRSNMPVLPPPNTPDSNKKKDAQPK